MGEAEYAVALFQFMFLIGYNPSRISILTTYNGQKGLLNDIVSQRCGLNTPFGGIKPGAISTVDQYQGQQNDYIILSLVRTKNVGHIRDVRRLVVALSRARLGLYVFCRENLFRSCLELQRTIDQFFENNKRSKLELVIGETFPTDRANDKVGAEAGAGAEMLVIENLSVLGNLVFSMQEKICLE